MMRRYFFKEFLNHFWLRPENALLVSLRAESYYNTLTYFGDGKDTIDVSCGDGVFSFITLGGKLSPEFDMFRSVKFGRREGDFDHFDYFDEKEYKLKIFKKPDRFYQYGVDWKENLLKKAEKLNFYQQLIQHDNNFPLPFPDNSMRYV